MNIDSQHTIDAAEVLLSAIDGTLTDTHLKIATRSHGQVGGGEASMVQALVSWAQRQKCPTLRTYAARADDPQIQTLVNHLTGLSAVLLSDETQAGNGMDITDEAFRLAESRYLALVDDPAESRGPQCEILCADHLSFPFSPYLYDKSGLEPILRSEVAFKELARLIVAAGVMRSSPEASRLIAAIGSALFELFKNTEDHAKLDVSGNVPSRALRGIHARRHDRTREDLDELARGTPTMAPFFASLQAPAGRKGIRFAEFSVFDSGPGLAARWRKEQPEMLTDEQELGAIAECFEHRKTTKDSSGRGVGLPLVIDALKKRRGFLRLRTGRQSLFVDFSDQRDLEFGSAPRFSHFSTRRKMALATGTLITFIMPLDRHE
ncbi:hypothetical protein BH09PSE3_BH09PSE3_17400 [soil metagenome]